jgi:hypothetical protein
MSFMSEECSLRNVYFLQLNLVMTRLEIKFSEELCTMKLIQEVMNVKNWKFVFNHQFFKSMEVQTHEPITLFIENHDY